jgi:hypothetical protein
LDALAVKPERKRQRRDSLAVIGPAALALRGKLDRERKQNQQAG